MRQNGEDLEGFISAQRKIISEEGLESYLPALWVVGFWSLCVDVLADPPNDQEIEEVAREWARQNAGRKNYFLAFRLDHGHFKVIARQGKTLTERVIAVDA